MPIGGVVITTRPEQRDSTMGALGRLEGVEIHGADEQGNIVVTLDTRTSEEMENLIERIGKLETVLHVGLTYLNTEDEAEMMASGDHAPRIFGDRRRERE